MINKPDSPCYECHRHAINCKTECPKWDKFRIDLYEWHMQERHRRMENKYQIYSDYRFKRMIRKR